MVGALILAFVLVPIAEIAVIIKVGSLIGAWPTVALLVLESALGAALVRREGRRAWQGLTAALRSGRMPSRELADAALILVGGTLMLTPGFITDVVGMLLVLPPSRPLARRLLFGLAARRVTVVQMARGARGGSAAGYQTDVVPGEVVDDDPPGER